MATKVGSLVISLALESGAFRSGLSVSEKELKAATKRMENVGKSMQDFGQKMSLAVTLPLAALAKSSVSAAMESRDALGQVNQALATMGNAAGRTAGQLQALASNQMHKSLYDDDEILRSVTANLLTFGKISGGAFDQAQQAAIDLSARLGTDLQSSALMVGKALNDPIKGITALTRAGVSFTGQQKEQIKAMTEAGDLAGAQKIILGELQKQFGGSAEAAAKNNPFAQLKHSMDDFQEAVGNVLLQVLPPITDAITGMLNAFNSLSPGMQNVVVAGAGLLAALGPLAYVIGSITTITAGFTGALSLIAGSSGILAAVSAGFAGLMAVLSPILIPLAAIVAAVGAVYLAWKNWDSIKAIVSAIGSAVSGWWNGTVMPVLSAVGSMVLGAGKAWINFELSVLRSIANMVTGVRDWMVNKLGAVWDWVKSKITWVKDAFFGLYDAVVGHSYIPDMVDGIALHMGRLDAGMVKPAKNATEKTRKEFEKLQSDVRSIMDELFPDSASLNVFRGKLGKLDKWIGMGGAGGFSADELRAARQRLIGGADAGVLSGVALPLADQLAMDKGATAPMAKINDALERVTGAANDNAGKLEATNVRIVKSFKDMANDTVGVLQGLANSIKGGGFLDILGSVVNLAVQLGSIGAFGGKVAANINASNKIPGYASGTNWHPGGLAMVGERGPELVNLPRGSSVTPNHALGRGGGNTYNFSGNLMTPEFWAQIQSGDQAAAAAGASAAEARMAFRGSRRVA